jgi:hypothetical protein
MTQLHRTLSQPSDNPLQVRIGTLTKDPDHPDRAPAVPKRISSTQVIRLSDLTLLLH